ncbi:MAG: protein kinase family protein [Candidatus Dormibacteria bacterium]
MPELISFRDGATIPVADPPDGRLKVGGRSCELRHRQLRSPREAHELVQRLRRAARLPGALSLPPEAAGAEGREVICAFRSRQGAELRAVLRLVPLTLEQAALLGDGVLAALASLHRRGLVQERLDAERWLLGPDGRLRLAEPGLWAPLGAHPPGRDLEGAGRLLEVVLESVTGAARRDGSALSLLRSVAEGLGGASEEADAAPALAAWRSALPLDPGQRHRVRSQLGALGASLPQALPATSRAPAAAAAGEVGALVADPPADAPVMPALVVPAGLPRAAVPPPAALGAGVRGALGRSRALAVLGAAAVLVSAGVVAAALGAHPASRVRAPRATASTTASPAATPTPAGPSSTPTPAPTASPPGEIPLLGPPSAPPVQQVALTASCSPGGGPCQFNVTARLGSHPSDSVRWELQEVNRCTGEVATVASGAVNAPAFYTYIEAQPTVTVPAGGAVAMVALAGAGEMAASPPLSLGPAPASCPS